MPPVLRLKNVLKQQQSLQQQLALIAASQERCQLTHFAALYRCRQSQDFTRLQLSEGFLSAGEVETWRRFRHKM
jgi:hypothetical protein